MSQEETQIYGAIIEEQILLQEIQAMPIPVDHRDDYETELSMVSSQITQQRAVLSALWENARAIHANSQDCVNGV